MSIFPRGNENILCYRMDDFGDSQHRSKTIMKCQYIFFDMKIYAIISATADGLRRVLGLDIKHKCKLSIFKKICIFFKKQIKIVTFLLFLLFFTFFTFFTFLLFLLFESYFFYFFTFFTFFTFFHLGGPANAEIIAYFSIKILRIVLKF